MSRLGQTVKVRGAASGTGSGGEGMHFSNCGGLALNVVAGDRYMVWTSDGTEPGLSGDATAFSYAFNADTGMYWVWVEIGGALLIGTEGTGPYVAALKISDYQFNCG